jgi:predicted nucleic acid-binding protein
MVRIQTEAVLNILAFPLERVDLVRCPAHQLENSFNNVVARREAVSLWLEIGPITRPPETDLSSRTAGLMALGLKSFDALHLASAELSGATVFCTVDLRLLKLTRRFSDQLTVRVMDPVQLIEEIVQWTH